MCTGLMLMLIRHTYETKATGSGAQDAIGGSASALFGRPGALALLATGIWVGGWRPTSTTPHEPSQALLNNYMLYM